MQEDNNPDYVESARGPSRLTDFNLHEIRRGSIDVDALGSGRGAVPAADMITRNGFSKQEKMSRTIGALSKKMSHNAKYGSQTNMDMKGYSSISPKPARNKSTNLKTYSGVKNADDAASQISAMVDSIRKTKGRALEDSKKIVD